MKTKQETETAIEVDEFCKKLHLTKIYAPENKKVIITSSNISRPGLFLTGFHKNFAFDRVQLIGEQEYAYLKTLKEKDRLAALDALFVQKIPCVILSSGIVPSKESIEAAKKHSKILLTSNLRSTSLLYELNLYFNDLLAPWDRLHGVMVDIYGVGVLIVGKSGVGKSETVVELIQRMHRLVADDAVCIKKVGKHLIASSPETIKHFMEVRGLGIIDIGKMYGASAVLDEKEIDFVINLEDFNPKKEYNRLGDKVEKFKILDIDLPMITVPVKTGRNLAVILEVAAKNFRLKRMGYCAVTELKNRLYTTPNP